MPPTEHHDLSRLKIHHRDPVASGPSQKRLPALLMYLGGGLFLVLGVYFFLRTAFTPDVVVETTTVSLVSPSQANAVLTASGYVVAQRKAAVASKATGRLVFLGFGEGDVVKKGQVIGRLENADVEAALDQAKADLDVQKAEKNDAAQSLERARQLLERKLISQSEYDAAQSRYDRVVASIASRAAGVRAAEVQLENTLIRAPFDGTILTKNADIGEVVAPFAAGASSRVAIVTIADMGSLEVEADVSESNIEHIAPRQSCEITLDAYPEKRYRGVVSKIVPTADRSKATVMTKVRFLEQDKRVLPEMSAKVNFLSEENAKSAGGTPVLTVDASAIADRGGKSVVFLFQDRTAIEVPVVTGRSMGRLTEVLSGLTAGQTVILNPSPKLSSGTAVVLKK
jgi:RND family efflux transporter MFP subunit